MMKTIALTGFIAAALVGAPVAAADINVSGINIGNQGNAHASFGNVAVALGPTSQANATGGVANVAFASGGAVASKQGPGSANLLVAVGGGSRASVVGSNLTLTSDFNGGQSSVNGANGAISVAVGRNSKPSTTSIIDQNLSVQTAFCGGTATSAQGRINVAAPCIGLGD